MAATKIPWTDATWNPIRYLDGWMCTKVSPGCAHCYAEAMNLRFGNNYRYGVFSSKAEFGLDEKVLNQPLHWRNPRRIFVYSMGDLFHEQIPFEYITRIFDVMCSWRWPTKAMEREGDESLLVDPGHTYQVLTKRPGRITDWQSWAADRWPGDTPYNATIQVDGIVPKHIWMGVSVENEKYLHRVNALNEIRAARKFVSLEPLLEDIDIRDYLKLLNWVIVGPETGSARRPCRIEWIQSIVWQCTAAGVPVFVKALPMGKRISHDPAEWPEHLRRREWPKCSNVKKNSDQ